ncbi:class I SAM-dependent methyltransferase [Rhodohalobacter sp. 8-1]|uniref:class I SAM-dependent methyltransferase n=1 Tax=Rhodohalobacter sp. 8-1 TaxID=3131972 RepID=UPI0030ECBA7B
MSWFEEWFDSPLYEFLYAYRNEKEAKKLADHIQREIPADQYKNIVDVGCGRGRHSIELAERGYNVTGFDLSPQAIERADRIASDRGLQNVTFLVNDMRQPLAGRFDAAINLFTTFGYFLENKENERVLKSVNSMLKKNGLFLIDYFNSEKVKSELVPKEEGSHKGINYTISRYIENRCVYKNIRFSGKGFEKPKEYTERVKLYGKEWFEENLNRASFSIQNIWGNYSGNLFVESSSPRLIILAQKREDISKEY